MNEKIKAAKHFQIQNFSNLKRAALRLALGEMQMLEERRDEEKLARICKRFKIGDAFAFYSQNPSLYW